MWREYRDGGGSEPFRIRKTPQVRGWNSDFPDIDDMHTASSNKQVLQGRSLMFVVGCYRNRKKKKKRPGQGAAGCVGNIDQFWAL
jgi:hypothetical protein